MRDGQRCLTRLNRFPRRAIMGYQSGRFDEGFVAKLYFEDFKAGDVAEYGDKLVTVEEIKEFAAEFDPQPMHLDEEAAKKTMMGGLCASGWHTCGIMMRIVADGFILNSSSMGAPGLDEIRWLAPVRPGDRLRVKAKVLETREPKSRPDFGFVRIHYDVVNDKDVVVMTSTGNMMFARRTPRAMPAEAKP
jgi:acyl dehydratase